MKTSTWFLAALCAASSAALAQTATLPSTNTAAVPTYESVGLYWQSPGGNAGCEVKYRRWGESAWRQGLAMWYDARDGQCRGSLVHLSPDTHYQAEFNLPGQAATRGLVFKTWSNQLPVAKTITVNSGGGTLNVAEGGSPTGYVVYQGAAGAVLDGQNSAQHNITVNASYVIVRGLALRGARQDAIRIAPNVHDVVIEDNEISGWGRTRDGRWGTDMDSAVRAVCSSPTLARVTVQRNRIHSPRYSANSWSDGHPAGPQAIAFENCGGNHVFRHNEVWSGNGNYFNDIFGGGSNFSNIGFPNADSDIYGNKLSHAWDDGIEAEGANENVRIWGNYIDRTAIGIATTATAIGPAYLFRNVWNRSQMHASIASLDQDSRQNFFKSGGTSTYGNGRRYVFHNTMLQARQSGLSYGLGGGFAMGGTGSTQPITNTWSMNNLYHGWKEGTGAMYQVGSGNNMSNDMYNGTPGQATIANFISGSPVYLPGHGWQSEGGGNYQLAANSPGYGRGLRIANFNDGASAPDVGAHQSGTASMRFGLAASSGSATSGGSNPVPPPPPPPTGSPSTPSNGVWISATSLTFGSVLSTQTVTYTNNTGAKVTFIQASMSSTRFGQTNNCGEVLPGASCSAAITYHPEWGGANSGTLTITSTAPNSPHVVSLSAGAAAAPPPSLVSHFYRAILRREPDAGGKAFWDGEAARVTGLGSDVNEVWYAMAMSFFASAEYAAFNRGSADFVTDLYTAFFNRAPDAGGLAYWAGQIASGMPRGVALAEFMFSQEFRNFAKAGTATGIRAEIHAVMDFYRGLLSRLPDNGGYAYTLQQMRTAQCQGASAVYARVAAISGEFGGSAEYAARRRTNADFVGDLYNAILRRGGELAGAQFWIRQLDTGMKSRDQVRAEFVASPEFSSRVNAIVAQGCL